ncbi:hypothetical protein ACFT5C_03235 [Streptomyces sp. NPDC057116]|uniref:hypothetical protein n=1 Tax=Streptomyces sp. NPDC057116 TaxID=3346023 RepID=UPI003645741F
MRVSRLLAFFSGIVLALVGSMGTASAAPAAADTSVRAAAAAGGYAAPTMVYCQLKVRAGATTSSSALRTLYNRNGSCPGSSGHDSIPCWLANCGGTIQGGSYTCTTGGRSYSTWLPVNHRGTRAWVAIKCGTYVLP